MKNKMMTAVVLKYKRFKETEEIKKHLETHDDIIDEIIIWDNSVNNLGTQAKFMAARQAKNDIIYTQDDDCIVNNIRELYDLYDGTQIINAVDPRTNTRLDTLIGWGAIYDKSWINVLDEYIKLYGRDKYIIRDAERIFTAGVGKWHSIKQKITEFPSAHDPNIALYLQPEHKQMREEAQGRLKNFKEHLDKIGLDNIYKNKNISNYRL